MYRWTDWQSVLRSDAPVPRAIGRETFGRRFRRGQETRAERRKQPIRAALCPVAVRAQKAGWRMLADRVLGLGSPHGDDAAGWLVVARLRRHPGLTAHLEIIEPSELLDHLGDCRRLMLIDACHSNQPPGTIFRLQWPDSRLRCQRRRSSHALGLGDTLCLAETLGWLPPRIIVWGVEISQTEPGGDLTPELRRALPELERQILQELACLTNEPSDE